MNGRIRELADKIWAEEYWDNPNTDKLLPAQLDKFAQLIVQECANEIQLFTNELSGEYYVGFNIGLVLASKIIEQHFGVEE